MKDETRRLNILHVSGSATTRRRDVVVREYPVTIFLNDVDLVTLLCSPMDLEYLAVGFLFGEGLIKNKKEIKRLFADKKDGAVWVETYKKRKSLDNILAKRYITTGCGKGLSYTDPAEGGKRLRIESGLKMLPNTVASLMKEFQSKSQVFRKTGGVHSAGLANDGGFVAFKEDIGRHNAIDKILGECVLKGTKCNDLVMITSGRVSSDILIKAARGRIPVIISKSAPTDLAVRLARKLGITLVGFARGSRMNVYSNEWRIANGSNAKTSASTHALPKK
jgi:FdhD protein